MLELASVNDSLADAYANEVRKRERELEDVETSRRRERKLKEHIRRIRHESDEAVQLKQVEIKKMELEVSMAVLVIYVNTR